MAMPPAPSEKFVPNLDNITKRTKTKNRTSIQASNSFLLKDSDFRKLELVEALLSQESEDDNTQLIIQSKKHLKKIKRKIQNYVTNEVHISPDELKMLLEVNDRVTGLIKALKELVADQFQKKTKIVDSFLIKV